MRLPRLVMNSVATPARRLRTAAAAGLFGSLSMFAGCDVPSFVDPGESMTRQANRGEPLVVKILDSIDPVIEETNREFATATDPRPEDLVIERTDYVLSPNDLLVVTISDLQGPGLDTIKQMRISGTGNVTLPYLDNPLRAEGLTEYEAQQAVRQAYQQAGVLQNAQVSVQVIEARGRAFSILGSVQRPGVYAIVEEDFRVLDALTLAGDVQSPLLETLYIIRRTGDTPGRPGDAGLPGVGPTTVPADDPMAPPADDLAPSADDAAPPADDVAPPTGDAAPPQSNSRRLPGRVRAVHLQVDREDASDMPADGFAPEPAEGPAAAGDAPSAADAPVDAPIDPAGPADAPIDPAGPADAPIDPATATDAPVDAPIDPATATDAPVDAPIDPADAPEVIMDDEDPAARVGRIDGQDVVVQPGDAPATQAAGDPAATSPIGGEAGRFEFNDLTMPEDIRVIRIPLDRLRAGELQYNVAIRPKDTLLIPSLTIGEYYMGGHVARPGAYSLTGRRITLKQAVISASGLDGLAIPQRTDVIRRINKDQEVYVRVNLAKVFNGQQPDLYLKPDDQVVVGTNFLAPFLAAVRGGFRLTYGLGFLYDRNFAADENNSFGR